MLNVSPIGRNCTQEERVAFFEYDKVCKEPQSVQSTSFKCSTYTNIRCSPYQSVAMKRLLRETIMHVSHASGAPNLLF